MVLCLSLFSNLFFPFFLGGIHGKSLMYPGTRGMFPRSFLGMTAWHAPELVNRVVEFIESLGGWWLWPFYCRNQEPYGRWTSACVFYWGWRLIYWGWRLICFVGGWSVLKDNSHLWLEVDFWWMPCYASPLIESHFAFKQVDMNDQSLISGRCGVQHLTNEDVQCTTHLNFNIAAENISSQKESSLPTIIFQGLC